MILQVPLFQNNFIFHNYLLLTYEHAADLNIAIFLLRHHCEIGSLVLAAFRRLHQAFYAVAAFSCCDEPYDQKQCGE